MEPGWQRNVVVGPLLVALVVWFGVVAVVDGGKTVSEGLVEALWLCAWLIAIFVTERLIHAVPVRFLALGFSLAAISGVEQLISDGTTTWTAAAWAVAVAAVVIAVQLIVAAVGRRAATGYSPSPGRRSFVIAASMLGRSFSKPLSTIQPP